MYGCHKSICTFYLILISKWCVFLSGMPSLSKTFNHLFGSLIRPSDSLDKAQIYELYELFDCLVDKIRSC